MAACRALGHLQDVVGLIFIAVLVGLTCDSETCLLRGEASSVLRNCKTATLPGLNECTAPCNIRVSHKEHRSVQLSHHRGDCVSVTPTNV